MKPNVKVIILIGLLDFVISVCLVYPAKYLLVDYKSNFFHEKYDIELAFFNIIVIISYMILKVMTRDCKDYKDETIEEHFCIHLRQKDHWFLLVF